MSHIVFFLYLVDGFSIHFLIVFQFSSFAHQLIVDHFSIFSRLFDRVILICVSDRDFWIVFFQSSKLLLLTFSLPYLHIYSWQYLLKPFLGSFSDLFSFSSLLLMPFVLFSILTVTLIVNVSIVRLFRSIFSLNHFDFYDFDFCCHFDCANDVLVFGFETCASECGFWSGSFGEFVWLLVSHDLSQKTMKNLKTNEIDCDADGFFIPVILLFQGPENVLTKQYKF